MSDLVSKILDRDVSRAQIEPIRIIAEPLLQDVIDDAVGVFARCSHTAPDGDANLGILPPFHHIIEMVDGVQVLLAESGVAASLPVLRSAFEALVGIKYVLKENSENRALCYVVADLKDRIRWYDSMDPRTDRGTQYRQDIGLKDNPDYPIPPLDEVERGRAQIEGLLEQPLFRPHSDEYERTRRARKGIPPWFSLYEGPRNLRELTRVTGDLDDYVILYSHWSKTAHAVDLSSQLGEKEGIATIRVIRSPQNIEQQYLFATYFLLEAGRLILGYYRQGELVRYAKWYKERISTRLERLEAIETE